MPEVKIAPEATNGFQPVATGNSMDFASSSSASIGQKSLSSQGSVSASSDSESSRPTTPISFFPANKYVSLIDRIHERTLAKDPFFSLEFFPPRTVNGAVNLISRYVVNISNNSQSAC